MTITANNAGGWTNGSTYNLIGYTTLNGTGLNNFAHAVNNLSARQAAIWGDTGAAITLAIAGDNPYWVGDTNGNWNTTAINNLRLVTGGGYTTFLANDDLLFNNNATGTRVIDITENVATNTVVFDNNGSNPYTVGSVGGFGITSGSLTKNGLGALTINSSNSYTGATTISMGAVTLAGTLGSTAISVGASGTLTETSAGVIGGSASLTTSGTVTLAGANTYNGTTALNGGTLRATTSASALGAGALALAGGELQLANDTGLNFGRNTTVTGNAQVTSDTLTAVAGVTHTLGTLSIGANTLTIAKGANATGTTAGVAFGATTLTGPRPFPSARAARSRWGRSRTGRIPPRSRVPGTLPRAGSGAAARAASPSAAPSRARPR